MFKLFEKYKTNQKGFSVVELLIVLFIMTVVGLVVAEFQTKVFVFNRIISTGNNARFEGTKVVKVIANEIRSMSQSSAGGYPIEAAGTSTITFYVDVDDDGIKERIRYFISNRTLYRGYIKPTVNQNGQTLGAESTTTVITNIANTASQPIFTYYDTAYNGAETSATSSPALTYPLDLSRVRLVMITVFTDNNRNEPLAPLELSTQATIRNLKDNI